ncbi:S-4TM family putative pore-forming effector [Streptomyces sp. WI04-05B]|uniref:S-4TM family putative pore-forming effector n=1 Tax=Streptomyces TaxID=1883 RepID=UPI0029B7654B|nr:MULTISPECIES: S-4TM family putative pore-forming effector [unclassified Streptomyces]MDX2547004.1 S-4TM family putative pore-forming effector [Streptomyces sp. WI04-05B]MDX2589693.1 S-4TM family putative pore-forming effector [Streptomyces sp. WI04-05A]MDX3753143.1 S-4TM family putative pore-forming effector [Streptomyces sp. AK08-02]
MAVSNTPIFERQNDPDLLILLKAASVSHRRAKRLASAHVSLSVLLAAVGVAGVFAPVLRTPGTLLGLVWALAYAAGARLWGRGEMRRAALLQEKFDVQLLGLPWNTVLAGGTAPPAEEVGRVARRYTASESRLHDYFFEATALSRPLDVFACQLQTLGWGARVRRRYATTVSCALALWTTAGVATGLARSMTVSELLLHWFVPSLGLLLLGLDTVAAQRDTAGAREHAQSVLLAAMREHVSRGRPAADVPGLLQLARQGQDVLLQTRLGQVRVPDWFFRRFQTSDREDFVRAMRELDRTAADPTP